MVVIGPRASLSVTESVSQLSPSVSQSASQPAGVRQSASQPVSQSARQPVGQSAPASQPASQTARKSIGQSALHARSHRSPARTHSYLMIAHVKLGLLRHAIFAEVVKEQVLDLVKVGHAQH